VSGWNITAPFLSDDDAEQVIAAGGLTGGAEPTNTALGILAGLQSRHIYGGTVGRDVVTARRIRNKAARKARRITRRSA